MHFVVANFVMMHNILSLQPLQYARPMATTVGASASFGLTGSGARAMSNLCCSAVSTSFLSRSANTAPMLAFCVHVSTQQKALCSFLAHVLTHCMERVPSNGINLTCICFADSHQCSHKCHCTELSMSERRHSSHGWYLEQRGTSGGVLQLRVGHCV